MNENHTITLQDKKWGMPVRVLTLITFFLGAFTLVQAILLLSEYYSNYDVSMPVVILFLLITPFAFVAALMFAFGVHKIAQGNGADKNIILGFAMTQNNRFCNVLIIRLLCNSYAYEKYLHFYCL